MKKFIIQKISSPQIFLYHSIKISLQIDKSLTMTKVLPVGTIGWSFINSYSHWSRTLIIWHGIGADGYEAFKSKLKFQIQHEVFRCGKETLWILDLETFGTFRVKVREGRIGEITEILAWSDDFSFTEILCLIYSQTIVRQSSLHKQMNL